MNLQSDSRCRPLKAPGNSAERRSVATPTPARTVARALKAVLTEKKRLRFERRLFHGKFAIGGQKERWSALLEKRRPGLSNP